MECNKDEATRAKEIAERKFNSKDLLGAKKFTLKAQNLFPDLEGIPQLLATLDVYIYADNNINGEADWYGVLGIDLRADDDTIRKQYRKLALMLHPDKNKSVGADGAFKLISEAWSVLSDKARREAYDEKRNVKKGKVSTKVGGSSAATTGANGSYNLSKTTPPSARTQKNTSKEHTSSSSHKPKSTFWTVCHRCKMQYEYLRVYLNHKLLCPNCCEAFMAIETAPPPACGIKPSASWDFSHKQKKFNHQVSNKNKSYDGKNNMAARNAGAGCYSNADPYAHSNSGFQWAPFSKTSGVSNVAQAASVVQEAYDKVKREREEAQVAIKREEALRRKQHASKKGYFNPAKRRKSGTEEANVSNHCREAVNRMGVGNGAVGASSSSRFKVDASPVELQNLLMDKARKEIGNKLKEIRSNTFDSLVGKVCEDGLLKTNEKSEKSLRNSYGTCSENNIGKSEELESRSQVIKSLAMPIDVPDPDFLDFYKDRTKRSFGENQVWAVYDDVDGMPRHYAMILGVVSQDPFKMWICWLRSNSNGELAPLNWVASGFSKTCGDFRISRREICDSINIFSHKVRWSKSSQGAFSIYPRKGEVWALYQSWSLDCNELTADEVMYKFDMVEVLEEFIEEHGVIVIPLVKVAGFKTVFHHHSDPTKIKIIRREEMFRFSHQVPSYSLNGQEAPNAPKECRVLDPAATPLELLQVIKTVEEDMVDCEVSIIEETASDNAKETKHEEVIADIQKPRKEKEGDNTEIWKMEDLKDNLMGMALQKNSK